MAALAALFAFAALGYVLGRMAENTIVEAVESSFHARLRARTAPPRGRDEQRNNWWERHGGMMPRAGGSPASRVPGREDKSDAVIASDGRIDHGGLHGDHHRTQGCNQG